ncbi:hypothetical protein GFS24_03470 [Chitinophaga sp. SYP-B3965]|uniref:hypothetical protein n=1 Tax=Chitinophaga sp. SYP-B3965 TaxID=2663120 RepID=UPI001299BA46|nr:hypothetical protein [Chitinophaga sp. SYP-B3965]MRG44155.1 hypothetical protein [Chitinophaga sp. SYP-B3965]
MKVRSMLLLAVLFASCTKEESLEIIDNPGSGQLQGNYIFLSMQAHTNGTLEAVDGAESVKTVTISDYITKNNVGTVVIDAGKFTTTGMGYSIDTTIKGFYYYNGILDEEIEMPFQFSIPPLNSIAPYRLLGADSLIFTGGIVSIPGGGGTGPASPESRAKYAFSGDTLILYQGYYSKTTTLQQGMRVTQTDIGTFSMKLKKVK